MLRRRQLLPDLAHYGDAPGATAQHDVLRRSTNPVR